MIDPGSLIGFGLALLVTTWISSAALCGAVLGTRRWLARLGPGVERAAAAGALTLAPFAGIALITALAAHSLSPASFGSIDHCSHHGHHPHLCLVHGGPWMDEVWAVMLLSMTGAVFAIRILRTMAGSWKTIRALARLRRAASTGPGGVLIAPAERAFCFAGGVRRPRIYISTGAWNSLADDERRAVLAHERAHIAQSDLRRHVVLALAALLGAPRLSSRALALWRGATERLCDQRAAREVSPTAVASALVTMSRLAPGPSVGFSFGRAAGIVERVEALLADHPPSGHLAHRLAWAGWILLAGFAAASFLFADPLHHLLETLLGVL